METEEVFVHASNLRTRMCRRTLSSEKERQEKFTFDLIHACLSIPRILKSTFSLLLTLQGSCQVPSRCRLALRD